MVYADAIVTTPWFAMASANVSDEMKLRATSIDPMARLDLARWGALPKEIEEVFLMDEEDAVREAVAINLGSRADVTMFYSLAADRSPRVRAAVASNPTTPKTIVMVLAEDRDPSARMAAANALIRTDGSRLISYGSMGPVLKKAAWSEWQESNHNHLAAVKKMSVTEQWEHRGICPICREGTHIISLSSNAIARQHLQ
jgi:hypothetical protein